MKILIWIGCILANVIIQTVFRFKLGGIPAAMFFGSTMLIADNCALRYEYKNNKSSKKYVDTTKGLIKGTIWYSASILYVVLGTAFNSSNPSSFNFTTQIIIAVVCIGLGTVGHLLVNRNFDLMYSKKSQKESFQFEDKTDTINHCEKCGTTIEQGVDFPIKDETISLKNNQSKYCQHCGNKLPEDSLFCNKCGTKIIGANSNIQANTKNTINKTYISLSSPPKNSEVLYGYEYGSSSRIVVKASKDSSLVVKLKGIDGTERLRFYVRAGKTVDMGVPKEELYVYFASGVNWYGNNHLFGENTKYFKDIQIKDFAKAGWQYKFNDNNDASFDSVVISREDFFK